MERLISVKLKPSTRRQIKLDNIIDDAKDNQAIDMNMIQADQSYFQTRDYPIRKTNKPLLFLKPYILGSHIRNIDKKQQTQMAKTQLNSYSQDHRQYQTSILSTSQYVNMSEIMDTFTEFYMPKQKQSLNQSNEFPNKYNTTTPQIYQKRNKYFPKFSLQCMRQKLSNFKRAGVVSKDQKQNINLISTSTNFYSSYNSFVQDKTSKQSLNEQQLIQNIKQNAHRIKQIVRVQNLQIDLNTSQNDNQEATRVMDNSRSETIQEDYLNAKTKNEQKYSSDIYLVNKPNPEQETKNSRLKNTFKNIQKVYQANNQ